MSLFQPTVEDGLKRRYAVRAIVVAAVAVMALAPALALAESYQELNDQLSAENHKAAEANGHLVNVNTQLTNVQNQINDTQNRIATTNAEIAAIKDSLASKQAVLSELVRTEYQQAKQTKLEQLVGSKNFSEFVERETYIKSGQDKISDAVEEVLVVKKSLDARAEELSKLNLQLEQARTGLRFAQAQAQNQVAEIEAARQQLKSKLARYGGRVVQTGDRVSAGDLVGFEGSTGNSTGSHLHFEVRRGNTPINPRSVTPGQLRWPYGGGFMVSQEFGERGRTAWYDSHTGIDMGQHYGAPVYAAGSGTVTFSGADNSGFGEHVIIDHGNGLVSLYGHLGTGR